LALVVLYQRDPERRNDRGRGRKRLHRGRDSSDRIYWYSMTGGSWFFGGGAGVSSTLLAGGK
jgi:hypothetical protein